MRNKKPIEGKKLITKGLFGLRGNRGRVEGSRVELDKNWLILDQLHFTLLYSSSILLIQMDQKSGIILGPQYNKSHRGSFSIQQKL